MRRTIGLTRVRRVLLAGRARAVFGVCLAVAVALVAPAAAAAAPPATLASESFHNFNGGVAECTGQSGTVSYTASGDAFGPYSGTFTETGTASGDASANVTSLSASFTIYAPGGAVLVTGTTTASSGGFWCQGNTSFDTQVFSPSTAYQATIFTANGNYSDQGTSSMNVFIDSAGNADFFLEDFASSLTQPVLISPTSKAQCMNGGWQSFGTSFKNQGDCVSFVASGGKNQPTG